MRILVVGGGAREHALVQALSLDDPASQLYCAPGNPGTAGLATNLSVAADNQEQLTDEVISRYIDLVIVGPEVPLAQGLADRLRAEGKVVCGPSLAAAQIEASKVFAKEVMQAAGVPTATSRAFTDLNQALDYVAAHAEPLVIKASGLAAGKGVLVCSTRDEAAFGLREMITGGRFGTAGETVLVEEFLQGEELSVMGVTNGTEIVLLPAAQDHKRLRAGDHGPNTGGMGAYAPVSLATPELLQRIREEVFLPTLRELRHRNASFRGILYAGLMIHPDGTPNVVEFNCRLGDPETQVILPLVTSGLTALFDAAANGSPLPEITLRQGAAVTTVLAAEGYPDAPAKDDRIEIPTDLRSEVTVYHAGTRRDATGTLLTAGGRVLSVTAVSGDFQSARQLSCQAAEAISFRGKQYRNDIGWRESTRLTDARTA